MVTEDFSKYNGKGTTLRKAQLRMLKILIEVDKICRKHNISYWLDSGTLLGAVRHSGFIPWDDDIDICVLRKDMKKLKKILIKELPDTLVFQDRYNDWNYPLVFSKVREKKSIIIENNESMSKLKNNGLYIDILPVEPILSKKIKSFFDYVYGHSIRGIHNYYGKDIKEKCKSYLVYLPSVILMFFIRLITRCVRGKRYSYIYGMKGQNCVNDNIKNIIPCKPIVFEGYEFMCVNNPDSYLTNMYGDYMQIPPEDKRRVHAAKIEFLDE